MTAETKLTSSGVWCVVAVVAMSVSVAPLTAQDGEQGLPPIPVPGVSADRAPREPPPIPLSTDREQRILEAVFSRFPDVDPAQAMTFLREHFPHQVRYFTQLSIRDVERSVEYLTGLLGECAAMLRARTEDPERYQKMLVHQKLELKALDLADALKRDPEDDAAARREALQGTLTACFESKQALMRDELATLEAELTKLREMIQKRDDNRDVIVKHRMAQITGETDALEW